MQVEDESQKQTHYEIKVQGALDERWQSWFNGLLYSMEQVGDGTATTTITCYDTDQARLRGILTKIWNLNLALISVNRIEKQKEEK